MGQEVPHTSGHSYLQAGPGILHWQLSSPFEAYDVSPLHLAEVSCLGPHVRPAGPMLGSLFWVQSPSGCLSTFGELADRGSCVLCPVPASLVMIEQHMSGKKECIWDGRCDFERGVPDTSGRDGWGANGFLAAQLACEGKCRCAQYLVFYPNWPKLPSNAVFGGNLK